MGRVIYKGADHTYNAILQKIAYFLESPAEEWKTQTGLWKFCC